MNPFLVRQMAMYSAYHRDGRNRATHFIGIPLIAFSLYIPLAWVPLAGPLTLAGLVFLAVAAFYLWLDWRLSMPLIVLLAAMLVVGEAVAARGSAFGWSVFAAAFVGGWVFQLIGHVFEGRRPALADNLLQALIAPLFLVAETAFALGLRRDLHDAVESRWIEYRAPRATLG